MNKPIFVDFEGNKKGELFLLSVRHVGLTTTYILDERLVPPPESSLEVQFLDGELNRADLEEVTKLDLDGYQLTELPKNLENLSQLKVLVLSKNQLTELPTGLEKLTQLEELDLTDNQLTDVKGLEKLTQLTGLNLRDNPDLTMAQIADLQKALPNCKVHSNPKK